MRDVLGLDELLEKLLEDSELDQDVIELLVQDLGEDAPATVLATKVQQLIDSRYEKNKEN